MPLYDTPQAGSNSNSAKNVKCVDVGSFYTMLDGTETPGLGVASVAFARGHMAGSKGLTINLSGMPAGMTVDVQVAAHNIAGEFSSVATITPSSGSPDSGNGFYTDDGLSAFYRLYISAYVSGAMPVAVASR